ncbi:MAG: OmpA/MotB family protein, partial [Thermoguttaceae bacterium]
MALKIDNQEPPVPEWIVTFGDMMSLLLTFFILLFSMSEIQQDRSTALIESLRNQFGSDRSATVMLPGPVSPMSSAIARLASLGRAQRMNTMNGGDKVKAPSGDHGRVQTIRPGDQTTLGGVVDFAEDDGELPPQAIGVIESAAAIFKGKPQKIEIRGHASSRPLPPDSPYRNHWDLSYARAFNVCRQLVKCGI